MRVDVLLKAPQGRWDLIEVKQSSKAKEEHVTDAAAQVYSIERSGFSVRSAAIMHVDTEYIWEGGDYDPYRLFALEDVTAAVAIASGDPTRPPRRDAPDAERGLSREAVRQALPEAL